VAFTGHARWVDRGEPQNICRNVGKSEALSTIMQAPNKWVLPRIKDFRGRLAGMTAIFEFLAAPFPSKDLIGRACPSLHGYLFSFLS